VAWHADVLTLRKDRNRMDATRQAEGNVDHIISNRFFPHERAGVFVDVGAARPDFLSISSLFRSLRWRILAIEPNPEFCELHRERGHEIWEYACGDHDEDDVEFIVVHSHGAKYEQGEVTYEAFSSLAIKDSYRALLPELDTRKIKVRLRRLDTLLRAHAPEVDHIDILSVDVEGWELEVLDGFSLQTYGPSVIVMENLFKEKQYRRYMSAQGYVLWKRIAPNDVYIDPKIVGGLERSYLQALSRIPRR
jgi:FkbM family methyltransferase